VCCTPRAGVVKRHADEPKPITVVDGNTRAAAVYVHVQRLADERKRFHVQARPRWMRTAGRTLTITGDIRRDGSMGEGISQGQMGRDVSPERLYPSRHGYGRDPVSRGGGAGRIGARLVPPRGEGNEERPEPGRRPR